MEVNINANRKYSTDVLVVGGGTAGVFAAISAARSNAKVLLIEKSSMLGGTVTVAAVNFPGLFYAWGKQIISGPCFEAIERTVALGGGTLPEFTFKPERHWHEQIRLNRFIFSTVLLEMCKESGVEILTNSMLSSINETESGVNGLITDKQGLVPFSAKFAIDTTGDANLVALAGYPVIKSEVLQPATLVNSISGYNLDDIDKQQLKEEYQKANLPEHISFYNILNYLEKNTLELHIPCLNAETSVGKTELETSARLLTLKIYSMLKKVHGLENLNIDFVAEETGVRETCRIIGNTTVTADDYLNGTVFLDSVCYAFYPIDIHVLHTVNKTYLKENVVPTVPFSALVPKNSKRILCAGRCLSADKAANSALRVQAVCMATGQAVGVAAAICSKNNITVDKIDIASLKSALKEIGAIVPNI